MMDFFWKTNSNIKLIAIQQIMRVIYQMDCFATFAKSALQEVKQSTR
jgi:hypothetical protein